MHCKSCGSDEFLEIKERVFECQKCFQTIQLSEEIKEEEAIDLENRVALESSPENQEDSLLDVQEIPINNDDISLKTIDVTSAIVRLKTESGSGTAFFISDRHILTNAHVVNDENIVNGFIGDHPARCEFELIASGEPLGLDLAILELLSEAEHSYLNLSNTEPSVMDDIIVVGNPANLGISFAKGMISRITEKEYQLDVSVNPGNSGGPVLNQAKEVVGVISYLVKEVQGTGFSISLEALKTFIEKAIGKGDSHV